MKKLVALFAVVLALALIPHPSSAQIINGSFEVWLDFAPLEPSEWNSYDQPYAELDAVTKSADAYHGSNAARLEVMDGGDYYGLFVPYLYSWKDGGGHLVSERYLYVTGFYKLFSEPGQDSLEISVEMREAFDVVGAGVKCVDTSSTYKSFHVPIIYPGAQMPNNVVVTFSITGPDYMGPTIGTWALVDSVSIGPVATAVGPMVSSPPESFSLSQNYPNPFNPVTKIDYTLPEAADAKLEIYNVRGQRVRTLVNDHLPAGVHFIHWDSRDMYGQSVAAGIYFYRLQAGPRTLTRKMLLLK
jgi:hypothetical protein